VRQVFDTYLDEEQAALAAAAQDSDDAAATALVPGQPAGLHDRGRRELVGADDVVHTLLVGATLGQHVEEGAKGVQGSAEATMREDEGGVGRRVAAGHFVEQTERTGVRCGEAKRKGQISQPYEI
jgi:hypothetical protein